jgi:hypothetical protein
MGPVSSVCMVHTLSFGVYVHEQGKSRLTGTHVSIEMSGTGEFRGTMWTELRLGKDGYIAFVRAHLGYRTVLSVLDDSPSLRYRNRGSGGICAMTRPTSHIGERSESRSRKLSQTMDIFKLETLYTWD